MRVDAAEDASSAMTAFCYVGAPSFLLEDGNVLIDIPSLPTDQAVISAIPEGIELASIAVVVKLRARM